MVHGSSAGDSALQPDVLRAKNLLSTTPRVITDENCAEDWNYATPHDLQTDDAFGKFMLYLPCQGLSTEDDLHLSGSVSSSESIIVWADWLFVVFVFLVASV
jgi:hypothetical protein